jgi:septal ring factor EnvC (AmiA/AmiB activator)
MKKYCLLFITALLFGLGGCVPRAKLVETETSLAEAKKEIAETQTKLADAEAKIAEFVKRISQGREVFHNNTTENAELKKQLAEQTETLKKELTKSALLADEIVSLKKQFAEAGVQAAAQVEALKKDLAYAEKQLAETSGKLAQKQPLPVRVRFRDRLLHKGYMAAFSTEIKRDFQIIVSVKSSVSGETRTQRLSLGQHVPTELGFSVFDGDEITIKHADYQDKTVVCPAGQ